MDFNKYDPLKEQNQGEKAMTCGVDVTKDSPVCHPPWISSTPVILLIEYLRKYPDQGIILYEREGNPGVRFNPGIRAVLPMSDRAKIGMNATGLLQDAASDLRAMIAQGVDIPLLIHHPINPIPSRGNKIGRFFPAIKNHTDNEEPDKSLLWGK